LSQELKNITDSSVCTIPRSLQWQEYRTDLSHRVELENIIILTKKKRQMDKVLREAIEIELHHSNINREHSFSPSQAWKSIICDLREHNLMLKYQSCPMGPEKS
jgi:hypothetical protein